MKEGYRLRFSLFSSAVVVRYAFTSWNQSHSMGGANEWAKEIKSSKNLPVWEYALQTYMIV